jgi:type IV pilus assembly protein PilV
MEMRTTMPLPHSSQQGFLLIEVLIAIVVISFGLIGLAGLQAVGLQNNHTSYLRSMATQQAYDIADRMRANMGDITPGNGVAGGAYNNILSGTGADPGCSAGGCTAAQMATYDRFAWNTANALLLPAGSGTVAGTPSTLFTITVSWFEKCTVGEVSCVATSGTTTRNFVTSFVP